jgi:hypothetical protein
MEWIIAILVFYFGIKYLSFFVSKIESITKPNSHFKPKPHAFRTKHTDIQDSTFSNITPIRKWRADIFMSAEDKQTYMLSIEWQELRILVFTRDNYTCQSCGTKSALNCHHITYEDLGMETLDQLTTLCTTCHTTLHNRLGYDRTTLYPIIKD